ncbi:hypothetical protein [Actinomadura sp. 6N118]|uniref:hypothetical protein n=1 Tax=Actinomadura sp. 6N118 TaxID=3375151 RepID=UPI0037B01B84
MINDIARPVIPVGGMVISQAAADNLAVRSLVGHSKQQGPQLEELRSSCHRSQGCSVLAGEGNGHPADRRFVMKIVVVGGAGLIGSKLVRKPGEHGHERWRHRRTPVSTPPPANGWPGRLEQIERPNDVPLSGRWTGSAQHCSRVRVLTHEGRRGRAPSDVQPSLVVGGGAQARMPITLRCRRWNV